MTAETVKKRRGLQISLSTWAVLLPVMVVLMWANVIGRRKEEYVPLNSGGEELPWWECGWPFLAWVEDPFGAFDGTAGIRLAGTAGNVFVIMAILVATAVVCEYLTKMLGRRRAWFRIHLSTAILLMLVAAVLMWANIHVRNVSEANLNGRAMGWPMEYWFALIDMPGLDYAPSDEELEGIYYRGNLLCNILSATLILAATAFACEYYTRRRARKQQELKE